MLPSPWGTQKFKKLRESLRDRKRRLAVYSYAVLPRVFYMLRSKDTPQSLVIVVSPLVALMKDQVSTLTRRNVSAVYLRGSGDEEFAAMCDGKFQLMFMSQELDSEVRDMLLKELGWCCS